MDYIESGLFPSVCERSIRMALDLIESRPSLESSGRVWIEFPVTQSNFLLLLINTARSTVRMGLQALSNLMTGNDVVSTKVWPFIITESSLLG